MFCVFQDMEWFFSERNPREDWLFALRLWCTSPIFLAFVLSGGFFRGCVAGKQRMQLFMLCFTVWLTRLRKIVMFGICLELVCWSCLESDVSVFYCIFELPFSLRLYLWQIKVFLRCPRTRAHPNTCVGVFLCVWRVWMHREGVLCRGDAENDNYLRLRN